MVVKICPTPRPDACSGGPGRSSFDRMSRSGDSKRPDGKEAARQTVSTPGAATPTTPQVAGSETAEQALLRAQAAAQAKRLHEAGGICADVLAASPGHPAALALQGIVAAMGGDPEQGIALLRRAIDLRPGNATWYAHLSSLCRLTCRIEDALATGQEAIRLDPNNAEHLVNLSLVLVDADERDGAIACLLRALGLKHDHADGHLAMAQTLLAMGDFDAGWREYEWRHLTEVGKSTTPAITSAPWNGMRLPNGRLLLVGDQGYGDTIQFARYIPMVLDRCENLILGCSAEIGPLLANIPGIQQYCYQWNDIPPHSAHCRLSSLPYLFRTLPETIPAPARYIKAEPARVARWRSRLDATLPTEVKRIGLAWTGRATHPNDRRRSMPLSALRAIGRVGPAAFVSLQKPAPACDLEAMTWFSGMTDLSAELTDFGETAALVENLDLVVTVDTAIGHLAGAMGKPVWILIPKAADWRWLLDRCDSPWYPTARLFRQHKPGAWDAPLNELCAALSVDLGRPPSPTLEGRAAG
jgi:tetratricopeptide (TPR) repeat protein